MEVCVCVYLKVLTSASNASENVCHTVRGGIDSQEERERETDERKLCNISE